MIPIRSYRPYSTAHIKMRPNNEPTGKTTLLLCLCSNAEELAPGVGAGVVLPVVVEERGVCDTSEDIAPPQCICTKTNPCYPGRPGEVRLIRPGISDRVIFPEVIQDRCSPAPSLSPEQTYPLPLRAKVAAYARFPALKLAFAVQLSATGSYCQKSP